MNEEAEVRKPICQQQPHNNEWNDFIIIIVLHQITIIIIITCEWTDNQLWNVNTKVNLFALRVIFRGPF